MDYHEDLLKKLRRKGERALSQNMQDLLDEAADAIESDIVAFNASLAQTDEAIALCKRACAERDALSLTVVAIRAKAEKQASLTSHWRGVDYDDASNRAGEEVLDILNEATK